MIRDDAPPPPELPDVWDGAELEEKPEAEAQTGLEDIYAAQPIEPQPAADPPEPGDGPHEPPGSRGPITERPMAPPTPSRVAEEEPYSPIFELTSHVVIPAATIVMVTAVLYFLYDVRAVFLPGSIALKWVGTCFVTATVLIARYARLSTYSDMAGFYTFALASATILTLWMSPWDAPGVGHLGAFSNAAIILIVWRYASTLTNRLSADLDVPPPIPTRLYGLERLQMEEFKRQQKAQGIVQASIYDIGRRRDQDAAAKGKKKYDRWLSDGQAATRQIGALVLAALVAVAFAEPILLAGSPELAGRALGALIVFLFAAGVVISAAASIRDQQRLRALGAFAGAGSLSGRLALGALLAAAMCTSMLALPGFETPQGSGAIQQRTAERDIAVEGKDERSSTDENRRVEDPNKDEPVFELSDKRSQPAPTWVETLASLGKWMRWPVIAIVVLVGLFGLWRFGPALSKGLGASFSAFFSRLRKRIGKEAQTKKGDPFAALGALGELAPRESVLRAYGMWLDACDRLGHPREERQTPLEFLTALPRDLADLRPAGERLTRLYIAAAYATREIDAAVARASREAVVELREEVQAIERRAAA